MFKIKIISIHKTKQAYIIEGIKEYEKRLTPIVSFEYVFCKDNQDLEKKVLKENFYICLDEKGQKLSSTQFSKKIFNFLEKNGSKITFIIGGEEGLCDKIKNNANFILSLSELTFTHHMIRLILIEQIYRASEIQKSSKYHK